MINSLLPDVSLHLRPHSFSFVPLTKSWILDFKKIYTQCVYFIRNFHNLYSLIEVWLTNKTCIHGRYIMWCFDTGIHCEVLPSSSKLTYHHLTWLSFFCVCVCVYVVKTPEIYYKSKNVWPIDFPIVEFWWDF